MKEIKLSLRLTLPEYDTLVECVADELHRSEVFAGDDSVLAATCSSLLEKIKDARLASATAFPRRRPSSQPPPAADTSPTLTSHD